MLSPYLQIVSDDKVQITPILRREVFSTDCLRLFVNALAQLVKYGYGYFYLSICCETMPKRMHFHWCVSVSWVSQVSLLPLNSPTEGTLLFKLHFQPSCSPRFIPRHQISLVKPLKYFCSIWPKLHHRCQGNQQRASESYQSFSVEIIVTSMFSSNTYFLSPKVKLFHLV